MKFKPSKYDEDIREITVKEKGYHECAIVVQTRADDKPGLFMQTEDGGMFITRSKALKLAWAIIDELNPDAIA